jgi:error-prone DNA polymerase
VEQRQAGPFTSFHDFARRTGLSNAVLARLSKADAFGSLQLDRRTALWSSLPARTPLPLFRDVEETEPPVELPALSPREQVAHDYTHLGLSLREHPVSFIRQQLDRFRVLRAKDLRTLPHDRRVKVAGVVLLRQRPSSAKGITFMTLEDETGHVNLIVRQEIWNRNHRVARRASALAAHGRLQKQGEIIHVLVSRMQDLSTLLADVDARSRDFH